MRIGCAGQPTGANGAGSPGDGHGPSLAAQRRWAGARFLNPPARMQIQQIMSKHVRGVNPDIDAESAWAYMQQSQVRHLIVVDGTKVVGVLSERDLGSAKGQTLRADRKVRDLMTPAALALAPDTDVADAAKLLRGLAIGCFPVMDGNELVGIITTSDLLDVVAAS